MELNIYDNRIRSIGRELINKYRLNKTILCGINGPYDDPETRVRNLSHLIIITSIEVSLYDNVEDKAVLKSMSEELLSLADENGLFVMREKKGKDRCNGVIGHAWVIEALIYAFKILQENELIDLALKISEKHEFQEKIGLWGRPGKGKDDEAIDYTLNHQLWYAASLFELNEVVNSDKIKKELDVFMGALNKNFTNSKGGKIGHSIYRRLDFKYSAKCSVKRGVHAFNELIHSPSFAYKEEGYHMFNIMALARIYAIRKDFPFFYSKKFSKSIKYINCGDFLEKLLSEQIGLDASFQNRIEEKDEKSINIYGYPYNVPGFEILFSSEVFSDKINNKVVKECIDKQFELTYDNALQMFGYRCHDKNTINYRVYEYYRYLEERNEKGN